MADTTNKYTIPTYATSRVRYYNGQFLRDDDFIDDQRYHVSQQRRHERLLHFAGIAEGLTVTAADSGRTVKVAPGSAVDNKGRTIVIGTEQSLPVDSTWGGTMYVELAFSELETNPSDQNSSVQANTRFSSAPAPAAIVRSRTAGNLLLAELSLASGAVQTVKTDGRVYAGVALPGPASAPGDGSLRSLGDASPGWAQLGASFNVKGDTALSGKVVIGTGLAGAQKLTIHDNGGLGFGGTGLNAVDKKLWSPADGLLRWTTHGSAASHAFEVSHQDAGTAPVHLDIAGNSWLNGGNVAIGNTDPAGFKLRISGGNLGVDSNVIIGTGTAAPQKLTLYDNGGLGFAGAGLNAADKKLWSPADGLLRWTTNSGAGSHAFEVSHQDAGTAPVHLDIAGNSWLNGGNVAIGATDPAGFKLRVNGNVFVDNAITPSAGNSANNGIMFPQNPAGGGGDAAFIRYFGTKAGTEATKLLIGIDDNLDDTLGLWQMGAERLTIYNGKVGVGVAGAEPADLLEVKGTARVLTDSNPIRFTSGWSNFATVGAVNCAEISNDTGTYKTLMIIGNASAGNIRRVGIWDRLEVNGDLNVTSNATVSGTLGVTGNASVGGTLGVTGNLNAAANVKGKSFTPGVSSSVTDGSAGIMFPTDPGGGGGDAAWIRYYVAKAGTETTKLMIGVDNDGDDSMGLWQAGAERLTIYNGKVGIGTGGNEPKETLEVNGTLVVNNGFMPNYVSDWVERAQDNTTVIDFNIGFFPLLVVVIVQPRYGGNRLQDFYSHVPPARQTWDDVDTRGETVYTINSTTVRVYPAKDSQGYNIINGDGWRRFKCYAWRSAGVPG